MMEQPRTQAAFHASPFKARAAQFFKKLSLRAWVGKKQSRDNMSSVTISVDGTQRAHSLDILRKPDVLPLIGFGRESSTQTDADDSSQHASTSSNSPTRTSRRYSALDHPLPNTPPIFAARGPAALFHHDPAVADGPLSPIDESGNVLAPAPLFLRPNTPSDAIVRSHTAPATPLPSEAPTAVPQITLSQGVSQTQDEHVQSPDLDETPRPSRDQSSLNDNVTTPSTPLPGSSPSSSSYYTVPESHNSSLSEGIQGRRSAGPLLMTPLPPPFRVTTDRGIRLSPSVITRQHMPLMNLPTLPIQNPATAGPSRSQARLRSIPSLPAHGTTDVDHESDHDNATLGESDEDADGEEEEMVDAMSTLQSDEEEEEEPPSASPTIQEFDSHQMESIRDASPSPVAGPSNTRLSPAFDGSPSVGPNIADYFSSRTYSKSSQFSSGQPSKLQPFSPKTPIAEISNPLGALKNAPPLPIPEAKSSLYHVASRSMINLNSRHSTRRERDLRRLRSRDSVRSNAHSVTGRTVESHAGTAESDDTDAMIGRLLRRTSMPSFHPTSDPPPYPTFDPRPKEPLVMPGEDDGRERLPPYSNSLYLIAIMPRKMEFSFPGVQAKDRKWRRVLCELEGTAFRVYNCPPGASGTGVIGGWWEKHMGAGDVTIGHHTPTRMKEENFERPAKLGIDQPSTPQASTSASSSLDTEHPRRRSDSLSSRVTESNTTTTPRAVKRTSAASFLSPFRPSSRSRSRGPGSPSRPERRESRAMELLPVDFHENRSLSSSESHETSGRATPVPPQSSQPRSASRLSFLSSGRQHWRNNGTPKPSECDLLRAYTLQHAESGLGNDYLKRKNVIRLRLEGEQFLLQARDVPAVVEWIEALHAGTNIALDLDHRVMPKGPMFPRRRRRRPRRGQNGQASNGASHVPADRLA